MHATTLFTSPHFDDDTHGSHSMQHSRGPHGGERKAYRSGCGSGKRCDSSNGNRGRNMCIMVRGSLLGLSSGNYGQPKTICSF